jgi:hypothetical protein
MTHVENILPDEVQVSNTVISADSAEAEQAMAQWLAQDFGRPIAEESVPATSTGK